MIRLARKIDRHWPLADRHSYLIEMPVSRPRRSLIRHLLLVTLVVAVVLALPLWTEALPVATRTAVWLSFVYHAALFATASLPFWLVLNRRRAVPMVFAILFFLNYGPELVFAVEFTFTGDHGSLGDWLSRNELDYDPPVYVPLRLELVD